MADNKYGRVFTTSDVEKILEALLGDSAQEEWFADNGSVNLETVIADMDALSVRFKFAPDEPLFILRGRDKRAAGAIMHYRDHQARSAPENHIEAIGKAFRAFNTYREEHPGEIKEPD